MRRIVLLTSLLALLLGVPGTCTGQTATGQITGTVKDASGAVMPLVKITVSSQLTGLTRETTTSDSGNYVFPLLPVGVYSVTAEQQGFRVAKRSDIHLNVDQVMRVDLDLQVGEVTQTVEVQANAVAIDSETAAVGQVAGHDVLHLVGVAVEEQLGRRAAAVGLVLDGDQAAVGVPGLVLGVHVPGVEAPCARAAVGGARTRRPAD